MSVMVNKVQTAQLAATLTATESLALSTSSDLTYAFAHSLVRVLCGSLSLLAVVAWTTGGSSAATPSSSADIPAAAPEIQIAEGIPRLIRRRSEERQDRSDDASPSEPAPMVQPVPVQGTPAPGAVPEREVILTPPLPQRTVVPPPTATTPIEESYILGANDQIQIDIFDVPELAGPTNGRYVIQLDGTVNLPWVGLIPVQGLTLQQAQQAITQAYAPFIRNPLITVSLVTARSLRVSVAGEVERPGVYVISPEGATDNQILVEQPGGVGGVANQWPTLTKAIQAAGGITQFADLRRVQVRRPLPDGSLAIVDVNLWELLRSGNLNQDIQLRDRDTLIIPTATALNDEEALVIGSANFSPETIQVNVVGEVVSPGVIEIPPNTPLNQALLAAGSFDRTRARTGSVELIRLNPNGTATRRRVRVDLAAGINEETNPALRNYDTIVVNRTGLVAATDFLDTLLRPVGQIFGVVNSITNLFDGDNDNDNGNNNNNNRNNRNNGNN